jgi:signal transduction histidine kinase
MASEYLVEILHGVGFLTGAALYAMLVAMVVQGAGWNASRLRRDAGLPLVTGLLGLTWNLGALGIVTNPRTHASAFVVAYAALGLLPAVFVHATVRSWKGRGRVGRADHWITGSAYALSGGAALVQFVAAVRGQPIPSAVAFDALAAGFVVLVAVMVAASPADSRRSARLLWTAALAFFAVSAWHLGQHQGGAEGWHAVVVGHHASVPLAIAILWSDYRFALADIFLKRALAVTALVTVVASLSLGLFGAHLLPHTSDAPVSPRWVLAALTLFIATALSYPLMRRASAWLVDSVLLRRPDGARLRADLARRLASCETAEDVLGLVTGTLAPALSARRASWDETAEPPPAGRELVRLPDRSGSPAVLLTVPTAEPPHYVVAFESLEGGRRVLSDDAALLENVALAAARRLDALRWLHERCERDLREELVAKLATEAELRALQAQLNPHFLFNALNTLGYLMTAAPERARSTLLDLTRLLRAVLKRSGGERTTLGEEVDLVLAYLAIERARFEERLRASVDVSPALRGIAVPPLLVQPLVENAIKHGIAPRKEGGEIVVRASVEQPDAASADGVLTIEVSDTGVGATEDALRAGRARGVGVTNVEKRLQAHYGLGASLALTSRPGEGTRVVLRFPCTVIHRAVRERVVASAPGRGLGH